MTAAKPGAVRAIADVTEGIILATVEIAVPPERVFTALTTDEITRWWGSPELYLTTEWTADLRVGGRWRADGKGADGTAFFVEGEYLEIDPPRKLVQTWKPQWEPGTATTITYRLEPIPTGTRLVMRHEGFVGRPESCQGHSQGWERVLGWLVGHLHGARGAAAPERSFFMCKLIGPRPSFPADMNEAEARVMQAHVGYWTELMGQGKAFVFGPVADPKGVWGLGVIGVKDAAEAETIRANDPTVLSGLGFRLETYPMLRATVPG
jgi:uncharacterized protein YndB with AHSA1/START domain